MEWRLYAVNIQAKSNLVVVVIPNLIGNPEFSTRTLDPHFHGDDTAEIASLRSQQQVKITFWTLQLSYILLSAPILFLCPLQRTIMALLQ